MSLSKTYQLLTLTMALLALTLPTSQSLAKTSKEKPPIKECLVAGPSNAPITIEEYSDFECPYCAKGYETIKEVIKNYPTQVKVIFKNNPLPFHDHALNAAKAFAAVCLQDPKKAGAMQAQIFENQIRLGEGENFLYEVASQVGADVNKMKADMEGAAVAKMLEQDREDAMKYQFQGTPSFRIGNESIRGAYPYEVFKEIIDKQLRQ